MECTNNCILSPYTSLQPASPSSASTVVTERARPLGASQTFLFFNVIQTRSTNCTPWMHRDKPTYSSSASRAIFVPAAFPSSGTSADSRIRRSRVDHKAGTRGIWSGHSRFSAAREAGDLSVFGRRGDQEKSTGTGEGKEVVEIS